MEQVRNVTKNVAKTDKKRKGSSVELEQSTPKRDKIDQLIRRYPVAVSSVVGDPETLEQHHKAMQEEVEKTKPLGIKFVTFDESHISKSSVVYSK